MSQPPIIQTPIFNPSFFSANSDALTIEKADKRYLSLGGGFIGGNLSINGTLLVSGQEVVPPPTYVVGVVPGAAANNKALVLGASGEIATITSLTATSITGTLQTAAQPNITSVGTLSGLMINGNLTFTGASRTITGLSSFSATTLTGTLQTAAQTNITSVGTLTYLALDNGSTGLQTPIIQMWNSNTLSYQNLQHDALCGLTIGVFAPSKSMTLDSSGIGQMGLGSTTTNCIRFWGGTTNRETFNLYRSADTAGLTIASRQTSTSNNKSYPLLRLISTDNASSYTVGTSANADDLFRIDWNDKPTTGFVSQSHRMAFNIGYTSTLKSGYPHSFGLISSADIMCIAPAASTATPTGNGCLYLVSDTLPKMVWNTNTPYNNATYGTAPITLNSGNIYIKTTNSFNDGTTSYDTAMFLESSNATAPVNFAFQLHTGVNTTSTNAAFMGTVSQSDLSFMTGNSRRMTIKLDGRVGVGVSAPRAGLEVSGTYTHTITPLATNTYIYNVSTNGWSNLGGGPVSMTICALFNDDIYVNNSVYTSSDRRLKQNIQPIDVDIERYKLLEPSSYTYTNQSKTKIGLIAQDVMHVCGEAISITENENMKVIDEGDIEGIQLGVEYNAITVLNVSIIKQLITRIEEMQAQIDDLRSNIST